MRYYRVDLLDFYRGDLSTRRLVVLIRHLPADSATSIAMNDGAQPWSNTDHRIADLWVLWGKPDHPLRAEMQAKAYMTAKRSKVLEMRAKNEKRKRANGLGVMLT